MSYTSMTSPPPPSHLHPQRALRLLRNFQHHAVDITLVTKKMWLQLYTDTIVCDYHKPGVQHAAFCLACCLRALPARCHTCTHAPLVCAPSSPGATHVMKSLPRLTACRPPEMCLLTFFSPPSLLEAYCASFL